MVVYFYPADDTPGCTKEACQFNDNLRAFSRAGVEVRGHLAGRRGEAHRFREKYGLKFPLLSDPGHEVMAAYGAWGEKTMYGKKTVGTIRSTFLVDAKGLVAGPGTTCGPTATPPRCSRSWPTPELRPCPG